MKIERIVVVKAIRLTHRAEQYFSFNIPKEARRKVVRIVFEIYSRKTRGYKFRPGGREDLSR